MSEKEKPLKTTATKDKPGRNDSCPCGSGKKYKHCCLGKEGPRLGPEDMKTLLFAALLQIARLTRTNCFIVPAQVFEDGELAQRRFNAQYDDVTKMWRFWIQPPADAKPKVIAPRRILVPN